MLMVVVVAVVVTVAVLIRISIVESIYITYLFFLRRSLLFPPSYPSNMLLLDDI